jgi:ribosome biogenesis GTPase
VSNQVFCVPRSVSAVVPELFASGRLARVLRVHGDAVNVLDGTGERTLRWRAAQGLAIAGDWLELDEAGEARALLPRSNLLSRRAVGKREAEQALAANVDAVWIVTALDADFSVRRIERYLTLAQQARAAPVVLLTKAADCPDRDGYIEEARRVARAAPVHAIDVLAGIGVPASLLEPGQTAALVGSSGVGKSTLVNHLLGTDSAKTQAVRARDQKGRHTTTWRELCYLPSGAAVIDTPGMREVQLWAEHAALEAVFDDVAELARQCRYRDCRHHGEPGCAVAAAVAQGELERERHESYARLERELEQRPPTERKRGERTQSRALRAWLKVKRGGG